MCSWSNWGFLCNGHFEWLLAGLLGLAGLLALALIALIGVHRRHHLSTHERHMIDMMRAYQRGEITTEQMLKHLHEHK